MKFSTFIMFLLIRNFPGDFWVAKATDNRNVHFA